MKKSLTLKSLTHNKKIERNNCLSENQLDKFVYVSPVYKDKIQVRHIKKFEQPLPKPYFKINKRRSENCNNVKNQGQRNKHLSRYTYNFDLETFREKNYHQRPTIYKYIKNQNKSVQTMNTQPQPPPNNPQNKQNYHCPNPLSPLSPLSPLPPLSPLSPLSPYLQNKQKLRHILSTNIHPNMHPRQELFLESFSSKQSMDVGASEEGQSMEQLEELEREIQMQITRKVQDKGQFLVTPPLTQTITMFPPKPKDMSPPPPPSPVPIFPPKTLKFCAPPGPHPLLTNPPPMPLPFPPENQQQLRSLLQAIDKNQYFRAQIELSLTPTLLHYLDESGNTLLHLCVAKNRMDIYGMVLDKALEAGVRLLQVRNKYGRTVKEFMDVIGLRYEKGDH